MKSEQWLKQNRQAIHGWVTHLEAGIPTINRTRKGSPEGALEKQSDSDGNDLRIQFIACLLADHRRNALSTTDSIIARLIQFNPSLKAESIQDLFTELEGMGIVHLFVNLEDATQVGPYTVMVEMPPFAWNILQSEGRKPSVQTEPLTGAVRNTDTTEQTEVQELSEPFLGRQMGEHGETASCGDTLSASPFRPQYLLEDRWDSASSPEVVLPGKLGCEFERFLFAASSKGRSQLAAFGQKNSGVCAIFHGPSGTGKTLAVRQIAKGLNAKIYKVNCSRISHTPYPESENYIRDLFREFRSLSEKEQNPPILLFDDADQFFGKCIDYAHDLTVLVENPVRTVLLEELDSFEGVMVVTTQSERRLLDPAFDRRFLFKMEFEEPDMEARVAILDSNLAGIPLAKNFNLMELARDFSFTGGAIKLAIRRALVDSAMQGFEVLTKENLAEALRTVMEQEILQIDPEG